MSHDTVLWIDAGLLGMETALDRLGLQSSSLQHGTGAGRLVVARRSRSVFAQGKMESKLAASSVHLTQRVHRFEMAFGET